MAQLWRQQEQERAQQEAAISEGIIGEPALPAAVIGPDEELPPILVKEVEQDGKIVLAVEGQSTLPQTVFNSTKYVCWPSVSYRSHGTLLTSFPQRPHRRRPSQPAHGRQVRWLAVRDAHPLPLRRRDGLDRKASGQVHGPRPEPHHLLGPRIHLLRPQRPHRYQYIVHPGVGRRQRRARRALCRLAQPASPGLALGQWMEGVLRSDFNAVEFPAAEAAQFHEHPWYLFLLHE
jgi:hypothetical protein